MIKQNMDAYAASLTKTWQHDRTKTVGASEVGQCARKVWYSKNENAAERDPDYSDNYGARLRGTIMENAFWEPAMRLALGDKLLFAGDEQKTFVSGYLSATPDGLVTGQEPDALKHLGVKDIESDCFLAEAKSADPRTNLSAPKPENVFQIQVQLGLVRETSSYEPVYALLSYTNASFWSEIIEYPIKFDPAIYNTAKIRATEIMTAGSAEELKPEGFIAGGRECDLCPFTRACGVVRRSVPTSNEVADPQLVAEIADLVRSVKESETVIECEQAMLRNTQQGIRDRLREKGVKKIPGLVAWSSIKGRKTYDNKKLYEAALDAGIDIEQFARVGEETDRLTITAPKDQNEDHQAA